MTKIRLLLPALLALCACSNEKTATMPTLPDSLATFIVAAESATQDRGWDGLVEAVHRADLAAQTAGRVSAIAVDVNDSVKAGQLMLQITAVEQDAGVVAARAQLTAAKAAAAEAELSYQRFVQLADAQYVSKAQIDQVRAARDSAVAAKNAAAALLDQAGQQSAYTEVRAPFDGIVSRRDVEPGETVAPGKPLFAMFAPQELRIEVALPQTRADAVRNNPTARVMLGDGREITPSQVIVFPVADPLSHSVNVRVLLPVIEPLPVPGTTAKVIFAADEGSTPGAAAAGISIPVSSMVQRGELSAVYVLKEHRLLLRQLRLGRFAGAHVEVLSGLQAGEVVASDPIAATAAIAAQRKNVEPRRD